MGNTTVEVVTFRRRDGGHQRGRGGHQTPISSFQRSAQCSLLQLGAVRSLVKVKCFCSHWSGRELKGRDLKADSGMDLSCLQ